MVIKAQANEQSDHNASFFNRNHCDYLCDCMVLKLDKEKQGEVPRTISKARSVRHDVVYHS